MQIPAFWCVPHLQVTFCDSLLPKSGGCTWREQKKNILKHGSSESHLSPIQSINHSIIQSIKSSLLLGPRSIYCVNCITIFPLFVTCKSRAGHALCSGLVGSKKLCAKKVFLKILFRPDLRGREGCV